MEEENDTTTEICQLCHTLPSVASSVDEFALCQTCLRETTCCDCQDSVANVDHRTECCMCMEVVCLACVYRGSYTDFDYCTECYSSHTSIT